MPLSRIVITIALALFLVPSSASALSFAFDYRFDANGFFANPDRRAILETAGQDLASQFGDDLDGLVATGGNTWAARFSDPTTGNAAAVPNLIVPDDTLVVFVGAQDLGPQGLGLAAPGTVSATGSRDWFDTVRYRGEAAAADTPALDFGPWGGFASFDIDTSWYFNIMLDGLDATQVDFYSVAVHELAHVMGFGLAPSWLAQIAVGRFTGIAATDEFGRPVPLSPEREHWRDGALGLAAGALQPALMNPFLAVGSRTRLTDLDRAGLQDVGWVVVPEPGTLWLLLGPLGFVLRQSYRRQDIQPAWRARRGSSNSVNSCCWPSCSDLP